MGEVRTAEATWNGDLVSGNGTINYVTETGKVQKCDLCGGDPACATACPTGAITYIDANWTGIERMKLWAAKTTPGAVA